ncbi:MAG: response regulator [Anaerolineae bacterium]|nr:response regulator [Anaerolineae bacterium]
MGKHILVIEDNQANADMILHILRTAGFEVRHFANGLEGAKDARKDHPRLILMDFNLPDVDGRTLALVLKQQLGDLTAPPIIACTARAGEHEVKMAAKFGCSAMIRKPFSTEELVDLVKRYIGEPIRPE